MGGPGRPVSEPKRSTVSQQRFLCWSWWEGTGASQAVLQLGVWWWWWNLFSPALRLAWPLSKQRKKPAAMVASLSFQRSVLPKKEMHSALFRLASLTNSPELGSGLSSICC